MKKYLIVAALALSTCVGYPAYSQDREIPEAYTTQFNQGVLCQTEALLTQWVEENVDKSGSQIPFSQIEGCVMLQERGSAFNVLVAPSKWVIHGDEALLFSEVGLTDIFVYGWMLTEVQTIDLPV